MRYDIIIVGSGPGGYVAAIRAAQLGKKTALVERAEPGGVCLNWGCIPTKALLKSAQVYGYCKNAEHYGLELAGEVRPNLEAIVARSRSVAETMSKGVRFLLNKNKIDLIPGFGRLTAPGRIDVDGAEYEADHIVLATGARPREMAFMPIDGEHVISSRAAARRPPPPPGWEAPPYSRFSISVSSPTQKSSSYSLGTRFLMASSVLPPAQGGRPPARSLPLCKGYICAICYYLIQAFFAASPPPQKRFLLYVDTQQISRSVRSISSRSSGPMPLTTPARSSPAYTA